MVLTSEKAQEHRRSKCTCQLDVAAWYKRYSGVIRNFLIARLCDANAADDCTSETFLRAFTQRRRFACQGSGVRPWLFTIARNIATDYQKSARRRLEIPMLITTEMTDEATGPEDAVIRRAVLTDLIERLRELPPDQAHCLRLRFLEDLSVKETARIMDRGEIAVRALQYRALRKLPPLLAAWTPGHSS